MNFGFSGEMIFLFFLVLILFGPKKMPEIGRQVGRFLNEFRRASNEFRSQIESEINSLDNSNNANSSPRQQILPPLQAPLGSLANRIFNPPSAEKLVSCGKCRSCRNCPAPKPKSPRLPSLLPLRKQRPMPETAASSPVDESTNNKDKEQMPTMGFLDHLEELRKRLVYSIIAIVVGFFACWGYAGKIYGIIQRPIMEALEHNHLSAKLVYVNPIDPFNLYLKVAGMAGLFVASPFVLYQIWCFISPGLYRNEKRYVMPFMASTIALFLSGGYFGYKVVLPQALVFLIGYGKDFQPMITLTEYSSLFLTIIVGMGAIFEMPILVFFLALMGIVSAGWMWRNIRYSILGHLHQSLPSSPPPPIS